MNPNPAASRQRLVWLDMAKGLCMILVIYSHACTEFTLVNQWICSFFMGLFFISSGYVYKQKDDWARTNAKSLLVPYLLWGIVGLLFAFAIAFAKHDLANFVILRKAKNLLLGITMDNYPLWFIVAFFVTKTVYDIINRLLSRFAKEKNKRTLEAIIVSAIFLAGYLYSQHKTVGHSILRFDTGLVMLPLFCIGHHLPRFIESEALRRFYWPILVISLVTNLISGLWLNTLVSVNSNDYGNILLFMISTISGTIAIFQICQLCEHVTTIRKLLSHYGVHSLSVLCSHMFVLYGLGLLMLRLTPPVCTTHC